MAKNVQKPSRLGTKKGGGRLYWRIYGISFVCIGWRKYLNEGMPFGYVSLCIGVCSCMYAFLWKWDLMHTPSFTGVHIGSHLNTNAVGCMFDV